MHTFVKVHYRKLDSLEHVHKSHVHPSFATFSVMRVQNWAEKGSRLPDLSIVGILLGGTVWRQ